MYIFNSVEIMKYTEMFNSVEKMEYNEKEEKEYYKEKEEENNNIISEFYYENKEEKNIINSEEAINEESSYTEIKNKCKFNYSFIAEYMTDEDNMIIQLFDYHYKYGIIEMIIDGEKIGNPII